MSVSRWFMPALFYSASVVVLCTLQWAEREPLSLEVLLAIVVLNATMAFGLASLLEIAQWLRARNPTARGWWTAAFVAVGIAFSWAVGHELVGAVSFIQGVGYEHVLATILAAGLLVALNALRANALGGRVLNLVVSTLILIALAWGQHRYRMLMREARYAGVSAAFLLLTGVLALRIFERLLPPRPSNRRTFASVLVPFGLFVICTAFTSESATKRLYFAGLFPGRFVFAMHLPQLVARSARLELTMARAAGMTNRTKMPLVPVTPSPSDEPERRAPGTELVLIALIDAARYDAFQHYVERPDAKLHRAWSESCLSAVGYSPASDTAMALERILLRPGTKAELWLDSVRRAGVVTTLILDSNIMSLLDRRLPSGFSPLFGSAVRLGRSEDHPPRFASVADAARRVISDQRQQQLVWAHFFEVHEWFAKTGRQTDRVVYDQQVAFVGDQIAGLLDDIRASQRPATVVIMADHGEGIDHFATRTHGIFLYEPLVRVPLMIWTNGHPCPPTLSGLRNVPAISTLTVGRVVLDALGVHSNPNLPSVAQIADAPILMQSGIQDAIVRWPYKLIVSPWFVELFDLRADPQEEHNLASSHPERASEMQQILQSAP